MTNSIKITKLIVRYGNTEILKNVDFSVSAGEFVAILGRSGSGKSTLLHALAGFIPYSGSVAITGRIGMVFQTHAVFPWLTVEENIGFGLNHMRREERACAIEEHLKLIGMREKRCAYPSELSGGQVQRVALAQTLAHNPEVVLMDEPYGALDAYTRERMQEWLLQVWTEHKKTVVFVTHSIEEAIFLADRVLVLEGGKFIQEIQIPFSRPRLKELKYGENFNALERRLHGIIAQERPNRVLAKMPHLSQ